MILCFMTLRLSIFKLAIYKDDSSSWLPELLLLANAFGRISGILHLKLPV